MGVRLAVSITFRRTASASSIAEKDLNGTHGHCTDETDPITRVAVPKRVDDVSDLKPIE